jgi:hypothetical protein
MSSTNRSITKPIWVIIIVLVVFGGMAETCFLEKPSPIIKWLIGQEDPAGIADSDDMAPEDTLSSTDESSGNIIGPLKPIVFHNEGDQAFTVQPWSFAPQDPENSFPSAVSTAVSPASRGSMLLPLGTYTWCYWWEIGDINNDGMMEYNHALDDRPVTLEASDSDSLDFAEIVDLSAPPASGELAGMCGADLDISQYIVASSHIDRFYYGGSMVALAHNTDFVTLRGPITVEYFFKHRANDSDPWIDEPPVIVDIPAGQTQQFYLEDTVGEHLGNWDLFIRLVSVNNP